MENLLQKFCLTLVGVFSMNFSTYSQRSARNSAYVHGTIAHYIYQFVAKKQLCKTMYSD